MGFTVRWGSRSRLPTVSPTVPGDSPGTIASNRPPGPAPVLPALCLWLSSPGTVESAYVAQALSFELIGRGQEVQRLPLEPVPTRAIGEARRDGIEFLAQAAAALVRHGISVIVTYPLSEPGDRAVPRQRIPRLVEVFLRPSPGSRADPIHIPVMYRWVSGGRVQEREIASLGFERPDRPDVIIDGPLGIRREVALEILDAIGRSRLVPAAAPG